MFLLGIVPSPEMVLIRNRVMLRQLKRYWVHSMNARLPREMVCLDEEKQARYRSVRGRWPQE